MASSVAVGPSTSRTRGDAIARRRNQNSANRYAKSLFQRFADHPGQQQTEVGVAVEADDVLDEETRLSLGSGSIGAGLTASLASVSMRSSASRSLVDHRR